MLGAALFVLASTGIETVPPQPQPQPQPRELSCLGESSIVGLNDHGDIFVLAGDRWEKAAISESVDELWRMPGGRLVAWSFHPRITEISPSWRLSRWILPEGGSHPRFAMLGGLVAVTADRIYRLEDTGVVKDVAPTPGDWSDRRSRRGPVLIQAGDSPLACYGTSIREIDATRGHCLREGPHPYHYAVDFGDGGSVLGEAAEATLPFACGDVVVSNREGSAQARRLSDGSLLGRRNVFARRGSACLADGRAFIVGKREVAVFDLPTFRPRWRRALPSKVRSAVVCGGKIAVLMDKGALPMTIELPPE